jgi:beta-galactosidase
MAQIAAQIVDRYGNVLPYQSRIVEFTLDGNAELIGENPLVLLGGQGACYLKSGHTAGRVEIKACTADLPPVSIVFEIGA